MSGESMDCCTLVDDKKITMDVRLNKKTSFILFKKVFYMINNKIQLQNQFY